MKLKNFELEESGLKIPAPMSKNIMRMDMFDQGKTIDQEPGFYNRHEYLLKLTVACKFVANRAELDRARENAEFLLLDGLYRDVITELLKIRTLSDNPEVDMEIGKLISKLRGGLADV